MKSYIAGIAFCFFAIISSNVFSDDIHAEARILSVSSFPFTMKEKPAVSISFGEKETEFLTVTVLRENIKQNYKHVATNSSDKEINMTATMPGKSYVLSLPEHKTGASFEVLSIDTGKKIAIISVSARLLDPTSMTMLTLDKMQLAITGDYFNALTAAAM